MAGSAGEEPDQAKKHTEASEAHGNLGTGRWGKGRFNTTRASRHSQASGFGLTDDFTRTTFSLQSSRPVVRTRSPLSQKES